MIGGIDDETTATLAGLLEAGEEVRGGLASVSASLVLTDRRLLLIREGWRHRPANGIRTWALDGSFRIVAAPRGVAGALIVDRNRDATSFFVSAEDWPDALRLVTEARRLSARSKLL
jgi:hypothetical protein